MKNSIRRISLVLIATLFVIISTLLNVVTNGNVVASLLLPLLIIISVAVIYLPLRITAMVFFTVVLLTHNSQSGAYVGKWKGPLSTLSEILYKNLRHVTGIGGLTFNVIDTAIVVFLILVVIRTYMNNNVDRHLTLPAAFPMKIAAFVSMGAILFFELWGIAKGGANTGESLWQIRTLFWVNGINIISMRAFKTDRDFKRLGICLATICITRIAEGTYFYFFIAPGIAFDGTYVLTHADTVWFTLCIVVLTSTFLEAPTRRNLLKLITVGSIVFWGIIINDRRIAYVALAMCFAAMTLFLRQSIKKWIYRAVIYTLPVLILYVVIGLNSTSAIFAPVRNLTSVADNTDSSNWYRNVENYDLIYTARRNPVLGTGWGHGYSEVVALVAYETYAYQFHPHNNLLGILAFTGGIGLFLIYIYIPIGIFLASRATYNNMDPVYRTTSVAGVSMVIIYMVQAFGDQGAENINTAIVFGISLGCVANLANRVKSLD